MPLTRLIACLSSIALSLASARADPDPAAGSDKIPAGGGTAAPISLKPTPTPRPWAIGVPEADQVLALRIYDEGNAEFMESRFAQALAKYQEATRYWDHPAIRYNMALCLINLDRLIEAKDDLERGLAYGAAALGDEAYREGLTYRKLLNARLVKLTITCVEPGAEITLDGEHLFTAPGGVTRYVLTGDHQVVATKSGFITSSETFATASGSPVVLDMRLVAFKSATRTFRRWSRWEPFAVLAAGGIVTGFATLVYRASAGNFAEYDDRVRAVCPDGCRTEYLMQNPYLLGDRRETAETQRTIAYSTLTIGGALLATGVLMLYLNRPRTQLELTRPTPSVVPIAGGASIELRYGF